MRFDEGLRVKSENCHYGQARHEWTGSQGLGMDGPLSQRDGRGQFGMPYGLHGIDGSPIYEVVYQPIHPVQSAQPIQLAQPVHSSPIQ